MRISDWSSDVCSSDLRWEDGSVATSPGFRQAFSAYAQGGWQGLQHDQQWGGQGLPKVVAAAATENINSACLSFSLCPLLTDGVLEALSGGGSHEQKERFIPALLEGRWPGTMHLTAPQEGSDLALAATRAVGPEANAQSVVSGKSGSS